jgi:glycosyltransferase involved in cell wall biosynthesis
VSHNLNLEGAPRSLLDVGTRLDPTRFEPALLSPTDGPMLNSWRKQGVPCEVEPISAHGLCVDDYEAAIRRTAALRSGFGPELVVANTLDAFWAVDVASELGVPSIWIVRESESPFSYFYERWPTPIAERATGAFDRATRVLFVSRATEAMFEPVLRAEQSRVIPNGLALGMIDEVRTHATARTIRRTLGLPRKRPVLLCVGTPCQRKGQLVLLQALAKLCGREPAPFCVFVGCRSGPYLDAMQETITTLGLGGSVKLVDETPEPLPYYHCADLLVCPSFQESLPRVILEAMAFGLPVVASSVHGVPELARDGREAYLFRAGDVNALAASIARVLDDDEAAAALGASGRSRVEAHFALDEVVDRYQDLFDEVLDEAETGL